MIFLVGHKRFTWCLFFVCEVGYGFVLFVLVLNSVFVSLSRV